MRKNAGQSTERANQGATPGQQQPKRILGVMPNFRAVSAGRSRRRPPRSRVSFSQPRIASTILHLFRWPNLSMAEWTVAHPQLDRDFRVWPILLARVCRQDGWQLPGYLRTANCIPPGRTLLRDGKGSILKRGFYAGSRISSRRTITDTTALSFRTARQRHGARNFGGVLPERKPDCQRARHEIRLCPRARRVDQRVPRILARHRHPRAAPTPVN